MAHEIFGERFYSLREPAWHRLGLVAEEPMTAVQALEKLGEYTVRRERAFTETGLPTPFYILVRDPTPDDPDRVPFGIVTEKYELITPRQFCEAWDTAVKSPLETLGVLKKGRIIFLTTKLPDITLSGDKCWNYLLATNEMGGEEALEIRVTPIRVVCMNTLIMGREKTTELYRIVHTENALQLLKKWLSDIEDRAIAKVEILKEAAEILASCRVKNPKPLIEEIYPIPPVPQDGETKEKMWQYEVESVRRKRNACFELFLGRGTGINTPGCWGTAWGLYNAVCELEDFRRGRNADFNLLWGGRAKTKERAFDILYKFAKGRG